ncbi:hypothetical protein GCM10022251_43430 [Phytohabitans flavus]
MFGVGLPQRPEHDSRRRRRGAVCGHDGKWQGAEPSGKLGHERPGRRVGQVHVVEEQRQRGAGRATPEDRQQRRLDGRVTPHGRRGCGQRGRCGSNQPGESVQDGRQLAGRHKVAGPRAEAAAHGGRAARLRQSGLAADQVGQRRIPAAAWRAVAHPPPRAGRRERLAGQPGLADPGGAGHPDERGHPLAEGPRHPIDHSGQIGVAADEWDGTVGRGRRYRGEGPPHVDGRGLACRGDRGKRRVVHPRPGGAPRRGGDHDRARRRVGLHPGRGVDDVAADQCLSPVAHGGEVDDDLAGGHPDPGPQRRAVGPGETGELALHVQTGEHRPERVVLIGVGRAEDGEHRVADVLLHHAPPATDGAGDAAEVLPLEGAHVLRIEAVGAAGEADQIHEENADPAPLIPAGRRIGRREAESRGAVATGPRHGNHDWPGAVPNRRYPCPEARGRTAPISRRIRSGGSASPRGEA